MSTSAKEMRVFARWLKTGPTSCEHVLREAAARLREPFEAAGFGLVEKTFDGSGNPAHSLNLERSDTSGAVDYVVITLDKRHHLRFQIIFGSKEARAPYRWIRSGALVWRPRSELDKHKWWGANFWHVNKPQALAHAVAKVALLVPQALRFLACGEVGENVHSVQISDTGEGENRRRPTGFQ